MSLTGWRHRLSVSLDVLAVMHLYHLQVFISVNSEWAG